MELNEAEDILFNQFGWAVTLPGANTVVDLVVNGKDLSFQGKGYHDQNFVCFLLPLVLNRTFFPA